MFSRLLFFITLSFLFACGSGGAPANEERLEEKRASIETRLINELSPGDDRPGRERNAIINMAIEEVWDLQAAPEGYFYEIIEPGNGAPAMMWDAVKIHYQGSYLDGKTFDDSRQRGKKIAFKVGQIIPAWNLGLQRLANGGRMRIVTPSELAYGAEGLVSADGDTIVGAHQILVFDMDGLEITERALEEEW